MVVILCEYIFVSKKYNIKFAMFYIKANKADTSEMSCLRGPMAVKQSILTKIWYSFNYGNERKLLFISGTFPKVFVNKNLNPA